MMALSSLSPIPPGNSRWRSVLISKKWAPRGGEKKRINQLPVVIAAATEKIILRRDRYPQYIQSEDLTATQFASLAGIRIKDSDEEPEDDFRDESKQTSILIPMGRSSSNHSCSQKNQLPQIWDSAFWQQQDDRDKTSLACNLPDAASSSPALSPSPSYASTTSSTCSEQSMSTVGRSSLTRPPGPSVIHKGRFKIVVGQDDGDTKPVEPQCVEWRRKRACTN
ncbi:hypothetical protein BX666DRAFT_1391561 [Dichotomocladium elegans]|nr:hypothetical protein BX666DRAFT_1391561 [Dichotomocladium elegans]